MEIQKLQKVLNKFRKRKDMEGTGLYYFKNMFGSWICTEDISFVVYNYKGVYFIDKDMEVLAEFEDNEGCEEARFIMNNLGCEG